MKKVIVFLSEVKQELTKVTWPKKDEVVKLVSLVLVISIVVSLYVGGLDYILTKALEYFVSN